MAEMEMMEKMETLDLRERKEIQVPQEELEIQDHQRYFHQTCLILRLPHHIFKVQRGTEVILALQDLRGLLEKEVRWGILDCKDRKEIKE